MASEALTASDLQNLFPSSSHSSIPFLGEDFLSPCRWTSTHSSAQPQHGGPGSILINAIFYFEDMFMYFFLLIGALPEQTGFLIFVFLRPSHTEKKVHNNCLLNKQIFYCQTSSIKVPFAWFWSPPANFLSDSNQTIWSSTKTLKNQKREKKGRGVLFLGWVAFWYYFLTAW